ncbi:MAG: glycosyltransferase family 2 protein [Paracoccaceae bacterium]
MTQADERPSISVVIPAHNAEAYITECLEGVFAAGFASHEIVVVDDASQDQTAALIQALGIEPFVLSENRGAAGARNAGVAAAKGEIIVFVDADVVVHRDIRARILDQFRYDDAPAAIFGSYDTAPACPARVSRVRNLLHHHVHQINAGPMTSFWTGLGVIRRDVFEALGGFDEGVSMMEDIELGMRLHLACHRIELDPALQGTHLKRWTLRSMTRTDLWDRAVPWTQLMSSEAGKKMPEMLNVSTDGKLSVIAVGLSLLSAIGIVIFPIASLLSLLISLALFIYANRGFLGFIRTLDGWVQTPGAIGVLWLHYLCAGLGYALVKLGLV